MSAESGPIVKPKYVRKAKLRVTGRSRPSLAVPPLDIYATLTCGHDILWDDPDEDVNASFFCSSCGGHFRVESFSGGAA